MTLGNVNVQIKSINKIAGTDVTEADFFTGVAPSATDDVSVSVIPRTDNNGTTTYDIVITTVELS